MDADAKLNASFRRQASVAVDEAVLHLDRAAHGVDHAGKLDDAAVASALGHAAVAGGDDRVDQVAAQRPEPRESSLFVGAGKPAVADNVERYQDALEAFDCLAFQTCRSRLFRAASLMALGHPDEGRKLVREAIAGNPNLTTTGFLLTEHYRDSEKRQELRQRLEMAGLPK
jgi:hypothetical protein